MWHFSQIQTDNDDDDINFQNYRCKDDDQYRNIIHIKLHLAAGLQETEFDDGHIDFVIGYSGFPLFGLWWSL